MSRKSPHVRISDASSYLTAKFLHNNFHCRNFRLKSKTSIKWKCESLRHRRSNIPAKSVFIIPAKTVFIKQKSHNIRSCITYLNMGEFPVLVIGVLSLSIKHRIGIIISLPEALLNYDFLLIYFYTFCMNFALCCVILSCMLCISSFLLCTRNVQNFQVTELFLII